MYRSIHLTTRANRTKPVRVAKYRWTICCMFTQGLADLWLPLVQAASDLAHDKWNYLPFYCTWKRFPVSANFVSSNCSSVPCEGKKGGLKILVNSQPQWVKVAYRKHVEKVCQWKYEDVISIRSVGRLRAVYLWRRQWHNQEFCSVGRGFNKFSWGQREWESWGGSSPLVRGSGGSCNLVQEISFHIVKFS